MLVILSPSKRQRFQGVRMDEALQEKLCACPQWLDKAEKVAAVLRAWAPHEIAHHLPENLLSFTPKLCRKPTKTLLSLLKKRQSSELKP